MPVSSFQNPLLIKPQRAFPRSIAIIGAGTIGPDIGYYLKSEIADLALTLIDINPDALGRAVERIHGYAQKGLDRGKLSSAQFANVKKNIVASTDYESLADCDWVLEAATENLSLKREIFTRVESVVSRHALITSNTSSIPAVQLFEHLNHPERATVTHFFAPAFRNPAVEVVDWQQADPNVVDFLRWFFCVTGKLPMVTADVVCFMLDRVFDNWCNEAALLLDRAQPAQIDSVASDYVHAGPFFVLNFAHGNTIIIETNTLQADEEGDHYRPAEIFARVERWDTVAPGTTVDVNEPAAAVIRDRLLGILFSQAVDILDRGIGAAADLELGCRVAFGFKRGPLELMRDLGDREVERICEAFAAFKPGMPALRRAPVDYQTFLRHVLVDDVDGVKIITLRRPEAMNALHDELTDEISEVIERYETDASTTGFVLTGYGTRAFCAGADIGRFPAMLGDRRLSAEYARACSRLLLRLDACTKPVVAAVNGMALGGGMELAIRCHGIVMRATAWFQLPEITLGIVPGIGAMVVPYRRWPKAAETFHAMLARAEKLDAETAHTLGVANSVVADPSDLIPAAVRTIAELAGQVHRIADAPVTIEPPDAGEPRSADGRLLSAEVSTILHDAIVAAAAAPSFAAALEIGYDAFGDSACTAAATEGIAAFQQRRSPDFASTG